MHDRRLIARAPADPAPLQPIDKLSRERPLGNILNLYVLLSILIQFAIHIAALLYMTILAKSIERCVRRSPLHLYFLSPPLTALNHARSRGDIDLDASFEPCLLNTAIYLLGLSQQVSTFAINFQGRPFRESISENPPLYWGLLGVVAVAYNGSTDFFPEANRWLQLVDMTNSFKFTLTMVMLADFAGCAVSRPRFLWPRDIDFLADPLLSRPQIVERVCKHLFADLAPKELVTRGSERRIKRREAEALALAEKKDQ
jgi:cation-transporting ATPase 13A1